jgi:hypothetical protein
MAVGAKVPETLRHRDLPGAHLHQGSRLSSAGMSGTNYGEEHIRSLDWKEHIRLRPGMYIGKLGDGSSFDDGIYILLKEVLDNCIDEFVMGHGKKVEVTIEGHVWKCGTTGGACRLGKVIDVVSKINTGAKYDSKAFKKSVGLNGVGTKAVNALSTYFKIESMRDGQLKRAEFDRGVLRKDEKLVKTDEANGTRVVFEPDEQMFRNFQYREQHIERLLWNYCYLNTGLTIFYNGRAFPEQERPVGPAGDQDGRRAALPDHPPDRRRHRGGHHPRQPLRRGVLQLRERPAHHPGRHAPRRLPRGRGQDHQGILQEGLGGR